MHVHVYMHDQFTKKCELQMYGEIAGSGHTKLMTINIDVVITCKIWLILLQLSRIALRGSFTALSCI